METAVSSFRKEDKIQIQKNVYDIPGVTKVVLSPITQKAIGCVIGKNVTVKDPYVYVNKNDIDLQSETSEFLQMKKQIEEYPEKNILLVYDIKITPQVQEMEEFFVCVTKNAKDTMEKQNKKLQVELKRYIEKIPRKWKSMGSEIEIDDTLLKNLRPLSVMKIISDWPIYSKKVKFSIQQTDKLKEGYTELKEGHIPIQNIYRKRIDVAIQAAPKTNSSEAQTNPSYPKNTWTDYKYSTKDPGIDSEKETHIAKFINKTLPKLDSSIQDNQNIDFYEHDYENLVRKRYIHQQLSACEYIYLHDVVSCKNKKVSAVAWHPLISGVIAVVYARVSSAEIITTVETVDEALETIYGQNLVLLWDYTNNRASKLLLQAHREIKCINFCPHNPNILIAGCENGQIVIWDVTDTISNSESKIPLSDKQQNHRLAMYSIMNWLKNIQDIDAIDPIIVSNVKSSHHASVMDITWLPSDYEITQNGKIEPNDSNTNMQFFTCSTDSSIYLWNLNLKSIEQIKSMENKKIFNRLSTYPPALVGNKSDYRIFHKILIPQLKFSISEAISKSIFPLTNITLINEFYEFTAINPDTIDDSLQQTIFKLTMKKVKDVIPKFIITTKTGQLLKYTLEKLQVKDELEETVPNEISLEGRTSVYLSVHDGPITTCKRNPFIPEIILTVGGKIFVVWNETDQEKTPVIWRKSKLKYFSGMWSTSEPHIVILFRQDSHFEVWNLLEQSTKPDYTVRYSGNVVTDGFGNSYDNHVRKNTYCTADTRGAIKINAAPFVTNSKKVEDLVKQTREVFEKQVAIRQKLKGWTVTWQNKNIKKREVKKDTHQTDQHKTESRQDERREQNGLIKKIKFQNVEKEFAERWNQKQEKSMYKVTIDKYRLNLREIEKDKQPLLQIAEEQLNRNEKTFNLLENKDVTFKQTEISLFAGTKFQERKIITPSKSITSRSRNTFISNYKSTEQKTLKDIKTNKYEYSFDWLKMIENSKSIQPVLRTRRVLKEEHKLHK